MHARVSKIISDGNEKHVVLKNQYCILRASIFFRCSFSLRGKGYFSWKVPLPSCSYPRKVLLMAVNKVCFDVFVVKRMPAWAVHPLTENKFWLFTLSYVMLSKVEASPGRVPYKTGAEVRWFVSTGMSRYQVTANACSLVATWYIAGAPYTNPRTSALFLFFLLNIMCFLL